MAGPRGFTLSLVVISVASWLLVGSCSPTPTTLPPPSSTAVAGSGAAPPNSSVPPQPQGVEATVDRLLARARASEPEVTSQLVDLARSVTGEMIKLEHRLKSRESALRKIRVRLAEDPTLTPATAKIDDALRYTMRIEDTPAGHHTEAIQKVLRSLEREGYRVVRIKNYWPLGDNYSGVNSVLETSDGFCWELQFHTKKSLEAAKKTRDWYEELRRPDTSIERKRELFDVMSEIWNDVPVPDGILEEGAIHDKERIIERPRP